jgi:ubiquitin-conjugating enzyme E2 Z
MSSISHAAIKRITIDVKEFLKSPIDGCAIYQCEDPLTRIYVVISGPKDSAYENGMYFFQFDFPNTYPFEPPKVKFLNWQNSKTRMHPNMYVCGKLCLSFLGTWSGPSWTSALGLTSIILSIQTLLDDNPLTNEPGYDKNTKTIEHTKYQRIVQYHNYRDFIMSSIKIAFDTEYLKNDNLHYIEYFKQFMKDYYKSKLNIIENELNKLIEMYPESQTINIPYQQLQSTIDYKGVQTVLNELKKKYL